MKRLPEEAFEVYVSQGDERSYQAVADHFGVSKKAVTNRATRDGWQVRLEDIERRARERSDERLVESIDQMNVRHVKVMKIIQGRALEALKSYPLKTAIDVSVKHERLIRGEPSERTATTVEDIIQRQYARWMTPPDEAGGTESMEGGDHDGTRPKPAG